MSIFKKIEELEAKVQSLLGEKESPEAPDASELSDEEPFALTEDDLERFVDGLLLVLSELELEGRHKEITDPQEARRAILAVIRQLYIKKSLVGKMSRKFARFGAKRFLRKQRTAIGRSMQK